MTSAKQEIFAAIKGGDAARVRALAAQDPSLAKARDESGVSALLQACYHFRLDIVEALRATNAPLDIFEAAALGQTERVQELLDQQPGLANAWSPDGFPVLGYPCFFGHPAVAQLLLERGAHPNVATRNAMRVYPLNSAASRKRSDIVKLLLDHRADPNAAQNSGYTSLHSAAHNGDVETVKVLLAKGADKNRKSDDGKTPLDMAEAGGHEEVARLLRGQT